MTESTEALQAAAGEAVPVPRNDAEAAQLDAAAKVEQKEEAKPDPEKDPEQEKRRNRTRQYIERLQADTQAFRAERDELKRRLESLEQRLPKQEAAPPKPEDFYTDPVGFTQAQAEYALRQAREQWEQEQRQQAQQQTERQVWDTYTQRVQAFAADKPDFHEIVGSIQIPLSNEVQAAIAAHESGPQIAYHLGLNDEDAFRLAMVPAHLVPFAVEQIASRLKAAPDSAIAPPPSPPAAPAVQPKPISQAPAPAPRVGGRSPTEVPPEKMTDDEWYRTDVERRRKR